MQETVVIEKTRRPSRRLCSTMASEDVKATIDAAILEQRERIKRETIIQRRIAHRKAIALG